MSETGFIKGVFLAARIPNLFIIALTQFLVTSMLMRHQIGALLNLDLFLLILSTVMVAAGGYVINDYYDSKIDMVNRPEKVVVGRYLSRRAAILAHVMLSTLAVFLGFFISWKIGLLHVFAILLLWYYSNHLRRVFIGKVVIVILTVLSILAVGFTFEVVSYRLMAFSAFGASIIWIRELIKDLENAVGEKMFGVESVPEVWGMRGTKWLISAIGFVGICLLIYFLVKVDVPIFYAFYICLSPVILYFGWSVFRADRKEHFRKLRHLTNFLILAGLLSMLVI